MVMFCDFLKRRCCFSKIQRVVILFFLILVIISCQPLHDNCQISLQDWQFQYNERDWDAQVPGVIHTDLLRHNLIVDPFFGTNEDSVQWVGEREWVYFCTFESSQIADFEHVDLVFEGLDTHAEIFLNGEPLCHQEKTHKVNNMFREWRFAMPKKLPKKNVLEVRFRPAPDYEREQAEKLDYALPESRAFSRKAPYHSGWDWGPKLITCGIWKPVYFDCWNEINISDFQIVQSKLSSDEAVLELPFSIFANQKETVEVTAQLDGTTYFHQVINLHKGENQLYPQIHLPNPELWYPNGMGKAKLYDVKLVIKHKNNWYQKNHRWGFRTIELVQQKDSIGESFQFVINGIPTFIKGTNWIPAHSFLSELEGKNGEQRYKALLQDCRDAHLNMIRIWGGGIYENEAFYDYCDENGLLVWQDFIFSCALYPGDSAFLHNVEKEAEYQIKRLRNHPSLALWCGNNEVKNGWEDWGWQAQYTSNQREVLEHDMHFLFDTLLANVVKKYDFRPYHPSSPSWGWGHKESFTEGDAHYWGVWWGELPFDVWYEKTGRFMSEYGFQSYPQLSTIAQFTDSIDRHFHSPAVRNHQKHNRGFLIINKEIENCYGVSFGTADGPTKDSSLTIFENFIFLSQLTQAYGMRQAIEIHRLRRPHCMGTLYWQLNDCWPVASWSSIDYYGNWKAMHYAVKRAFEPLIVVPLKVKDNLFDIYIVSDSLQNIAGNLIISACGLGGEVWNSDTLACVAMANSSTKIMQWSPKERRKYAQNGYIKLQFIDNKGVVVAEKIALFDEPKYLENGSNIEMNTEKTTDGWIITLTSDVLVQDVQILTQPNIDGNFSDNFITLEPRVPRKIVFTSKNKENPRFTLLYYANKFVEKK